MATTHALVVPFLNEDPVYAFGVEFGQLYARMRSGEEVIEDYFTIQNQDQILLMASRLGWRVVECEQRERKSWGRDWFWCKMEKGPAPSPVGGD